MNAPLRPCDTARVGRYPTGWPASCRAALDTVRTSFPLSQGWGWSWYREGSRGTVTVWHDDGTRHVYASPYALRDALAPTGARRAA